MIPKHLMTGVCLIALVSSAMAKDITTAPSSGLLDRPTSQHEVKLERQGGTYLVPVLINRSMVLRFVLDSGATDVLIPVDVFLTLLRTGTVSERDFLGDQTYSLADGSTLSGKRFIIRELKVGDQIANNVVASVGPVSGDLLLGLSFLSRFGTVTLDNARHVLVLSGSTATRPGSDQQTTLPPPIPFLNNNKSAYDKPSSGPDRSIYQVTSCKSIVDRKTQLEWYIGPDSTMTWEDANNWTRELKACGHVWRMPNIRQLRTLFNIGETAGTGFYTRGRYWPAHIDPTFSNIGNGSWVWAAGVPDAQGAPAFNFNQGLAVRIPPYNREYTVRTFAVRSFNE